jgi:hypothetical protein
MSKLSPTGQKDKNGQNRGVQDGFKKEYCEEVQKYIDTCTDTEGSFVSFVGDKGTGYQRTIEVQLPTLEGFGEYLRNKYPGTKTTTAHIWNWEQKYPYFLEATTLIRNEQAKRLMNGTLSGKYEKGMAQLILRSQSRHYNAPEKQEHTGKDGGAIQTESKLSASQIDEILDVLNKAK